MSSLFSGSDAVDVQPPSGEGVETVDKEGSQGTRASSTMSVPGPPNNPRVSDLVDLTAPNICRVIMPTPGPARVCGRVLGSCSRRNHNSISLEEGRCAPGGHYVASYNDKNPVPDGWLEPGAMDAAQVEAMRVAEREEAVVLLRAMSPGEEVQFVGEQPATAPVPQQVFTPIPGANTVTSGVTRTTPPPRGRSTRNQPSSKVAFDAYGLEDTDSGERIAEQEFKTAQVWVALGWKMRPRWSSRVGPGRANPPPNPFKVGAQSPHPKKEW